jgi:hypothetical protein
MLSRKWQCYAVIREDLLQFSKRCVQDMGGENIKSKLNTHQFLVNSEILLYCKKIKNFKSLVKWCKI